MKTVPVESTGQTLRTLLPKINEEEAVFLTVEGQVRFVVLPADEGDQEVLAMRGNRRLMEFLDRCGQRARTGPCKSLATIRSDAKKSRRQAGPSRANGKRGRPVKRKN
jgi:PHD/YefM family antitoxin component YafN of YafNO toxin-antitoxin module